MDFCYLLTPVGDMRMYCLLFLPIPLILYLTSLAVSVLIVTDLFFFSKSISLSSFLLKYYCARSSSVHGVLSLSSGSTLSNIGK